MRDRVRAQGHHLRDRFSLAGGVGAPRIPPQIFGLATSGNWKLNSNFRSVVNLHAVDSYEKTHLITDRYTFYFNSEKYFIFKKVFI
jgi:hypothetical protein